MPLKLLTDSQAERVGRVVRDYETSRAGGGLDRVVRDEGDRLTLPWKNIGSVTVPAHGIVQLAGQTQTPDPFGTGFNKQVVAGRVPNNQLTRYGVNCGEDVAAGALGFVTVAGWAKARVSSSAGSSHYGPTVNSSLLQPDFMGGFPELWYDNAIQPGPMAWVRIEAINVVRGSAAANIGINSLGNVNLFGFVIPAANRTTAVIPANNSCLCVRVLDGVVGGVNPWQIVANTSL